MRHILLLGGTTEASALATALAQRGERAVLSYAGRTDHPRAQAIPTRVGGFGGIEGLADHMTREGVTHLVDATHPFAARISANAIAAAELAGVKLLALTRPAWEAGPGDRWIRVTDTAEAVAALGSEAARIFLALGRQTIGDFADAAQHFYLLRFVDAAEVSVLPRHHLVVDRGPFTLAGERALLRAHRIQTIVAKNAGGAGARAKLEAARELGLPVVMIDRPFIPVRPQVESVAAVLDWLDHGVVRGV
ncbi:MULTISPECIES: cobalt-precorrin-6A reductase [unclassified Sphingomonas]|uniref:cobalt-precorrin-6A reductase n=1 Tax=unclassified Sphingomonas TaxID=196159 RepID=UPI002862ED32|nr:MULTISPECIES: cobalt-precorrin-6A reductase [unclassified Sphingomonas]MDR6115004.1 precorrin-6A/cobalt-precorrin-6A reductase [Sphingomonas sp. SORGH_AS_0789]MDR6151322.1 precorrin-6A/cobalt-precorrin-6A reductase [Sphingomonas sp. SORGH_AS_0742]